MRSIRGDHKYLDLFQLICSVILSIIVVHLIIPREQVSFENFALGKGTSTYFGTSDSYPIHLDNLHHEVVDSMVLGWERRGRKPVVFMFGNSQMHGVNQYVPGNVSYNQMLFDSLAMDCDVMAQSVPNANLQEILYMFEYWIRKVPISQVIVPVFFDDMREDGIRFAYLPVSDSIGIESGDKVAVGWNTTLAEAKKGAANERDIGALENTVQEEVEIQLNTWISEHSMSWRSRPDIRGQLFTTLYQVRNWAFGINPQSERKLIPFVYRKNFQALELLATETAIRNVGMVLYIPPIRSDVAIPYDFNQYEAFKAEVLNMATEHDHITVENFEAAVDGQYWGMKESTSLGGQLEYDFMHFSYEGHKALASRLLPLLHCK